MRGWSDGESVNTGLKDARDGFQFSNSMDTLKPAIPPVLLIKGHNPLKLIHAALSEGLHAKSDDECLRLAHDIRVVLAELSERISIALKDEAELQAAVSRLAKRNQD